MKKLFTLLFAMFAFISISIAQSNNMKSYQRLQASVEYPAYQKSLKKDMISDAKEVGKSQKGKESDAKKNIRFHNKLARLRGDK